MKVEKNFKDETNLCVKENLINQETKHACDYPNCSFVPSRSFNLSRHKAQQHDKKVSLYSALKTSVLKHLTQSKSYRSIEIHVL